MIKMNKILIYIIMICMLSSSVFAQSFSIDSMLPEIITDNFAYLEADVDNPNNRPLDINLSYKKDSENEYNSIRLLNSTTQDNINVDYGLSELEAGTNYDFYFNAEQLDGNREKVNSSIISFKTTGAEGLLSIDFDKDINVWIIILLILSALGLVLVYGLNIVSSLILMIVGLMLMFSGLNLVLSLIPILFGFVMMFYDRK